MAPAPPSGGSRGWDAALQQALRHPKVLELAGALQVDLGNEVQRRALIARAEAHLQGLAPPAPGAPGLNAYRVDEALRAYREIAAL